MTPIEVRRKLVHSLGLDLVGPDRDSELLDETLPQAPSRWYLTGFLVPIDAAEEQRVDEMATEGMDQEGVAGGGDDATIPESAAARRVFFPSSMGLSLLVARDAKELHVTVRWGDYCPVGQDSDPDVESQDRNPDPQGKGWRRAERVVELTLKLSASQKTVEQDVPDSAGLKLALSVRPVRDIPAFDGMVPKGTRSVSLFLVNRRRPAPDEVRDSGFAFQAALEVRCPQPFVSRPNLRGLESDDWDERVADLQYRDVCEFAVGHGISTRAILDAECSCREVHTRWIPSAEVERVAPSPIEGVELGMEKLATLADGGAAKAALSGLVSHYRAWIGRQESDVPAKPKCRQETATELLSRAGVAAGRIEAGIDLLADGTVLAAFRVVACVRGHIGDLDWYWYAHRGQTPCRRQLWIDERGTSGDLGEIVIRCECGQERRLNDATIPGTLGHCDGSRPWLGPYTKETCEQPSRLLVRHASNAYFPQIMSVISLPDRNETLEKAVNQVWENFLQYVDTIEELTRERQKKPPVKAALEGFTDDEVIRDVEARKGLGTEAPLESVKQAEFEVLTATKEEVGQDTPDGDFFARTLPKAAWSRPWMASVERVVLVHRLREVVAQLGFTRFEASTADTQGELQMGVVAAPLARELSWLPAVENRGEGVFIQFEKAAVQKWLARPAVVERGRWLQAGFEGWRQQHPHSKREFPRLPYFLLHSLSHLLLTAVSLECGYPASSIRERVYAQDDGYGILLFTGTPDAEGTLGGLIETGRQIDRHLRAALELGRLCSNDPVCAQHDPQSRHEGRFLHGAACHGCLLIAETCCEQHNDFLDRALLVPTVEDLGAEFFTGETA